MQLSVFWHLLLIDSCRYLSFFHAVPVEVFNVSEYRRNLYGAFKDAEWFDQNNDETMELRNKCNERAIADMELFLQAHTNGVVIFDSINNTFEKRLNLLHRVSDFPFPVLCDDSQGRVDACVWSESDVH